MFNGVAEIKGFGEVTLSVSSRSRKYRGKTDV